MCGVHGVSDDRLRIFLVPVSEGLASLGQARSEAASGERSREGKFGAGCLEGTGDCALGLLPELGICFPVLAWCWF